MFDDYKYSAEQVITNELPQIKEALVEITKTLKKDSKYNNDAEESLTPTEEDELYKNLWNKLRQDIIKNIEKSDAALHYTSSYTHALQDILTVMQEMEATIYL
jgi:hypothetical protein